MAPIDSKNFETKFNEYLSKLIYAVFDDIEREGYAPPKYDQYSYNSYNNLLKDKKLRADGVKNRFTITSEVKQMCTYLFTKLIEDIKLVPVLDEDASMVKAITNLGVEYDECYSVFIIHLASNYKQSFDTTLKSANDPTMWFYNQIVGLLPVYAGKVKIIAEITSIFDDFLKTMAWLIGNLIWYTEQSVNRDLFIGTVAQQKFIKRIMLDELIGCIRVKAASKPRAKSAGKKTNKKSVNSPSQNDDMVENDFDENDKDDSDGENNNDLIDMINNS